jgi:hypothetical protein
MEKLKWTNETRKLSSLIPWEDNPRKINSDNARRLIESREQFDQPWPILIGPENQLYDGHQRLKVWAEQWGLDLEVEVRVSSRPLTQPEREKLVIFGHATATGQWDKSKLGEWDRDVLKDWGMDDKFINEWRETTNELSEIVETPDSKDDNYTRKIEPPVYTPTQQEPPEINLLYDDTKTRKIIDNTESCDTISEEEKIFLLAAARRHTVLDFQNIAEYYAHASEDMQLLMEENALVIIDIDSAIEHGFVKMSQDIANIVGEEYGDE